MSRYKLTDNGVLDQEARAFIPNAEGNRQWNQYQSWLTEGNTPDPKDVIDPWVAIRSQRDAKLSQSDWTVLTDVPLTSAKKTNWKTYRQELRDLPQNQTDTDNITWPSDPT